MRPRNRVKSAASRKAAGPRHRKRPPSDRPRMSTQDTFISHLVELRDRLLRAILAVIIVFVCLFPWARELYALLAKPLIAALPAGGQKIATDVVGVFLVPVRSEEHTSELQSRFELVCRLLLE